MANKGKDKDTSTVGADISQLRNPIQISGKPVEQVLKGIHYGSPELRCLLLDECDLIFECKVCRALFRDVPNFISHKRIYCTKSFLEERHVAIASLPEEKVVVIQPQAPEDTEPSQTVPTAQKPTRLTLDETIKRIQSGELGKSQEYQVYTEAAEKLQRQKDSMKIATIRTTPIPTNKNAVFIEVNTTSVNIHERQQQSSNNVTSLDSDSGLSDTHGAARNKIPSNRMVVSTTLSSQKHLRKPTRQEKHTTEPQKLLLEQLKEIQHKVKQKSTLDNGDRQKTATQGNACLQNKNRSGNQDNFNDENANSRECSEHAADMKENAQHKDSEDLRSLARQNFLSLLAKKEARASSEKEKRQEKGNVIPRRRRNIKGWQNITKQTATAAAKELVKNSSRNKKLKNSLTCSKCNTIFSSSSSLGFHMKIQHSSKRTFYQCPYCTSSFYYFYGITRHLFRNHSKTADEINAMRSQLRDKAIVKTIPPPKQKNARLETQISCRRSARGQVEDEASGKGKVNEAVNTSHNKSSKKVEGVNYCAKTHLYRHNRKKTFIDFNEPETILLDDSSSSEDASSVISHKADEDILRENEKEATTYKSRSFGFTKSSLLTPTGSDEFNKNCPTCKKSFSRPRNYENHLKNCQNSKSPSKMVADKPVTPSKVQLTSPAVVQHEAADSKLSALKDKLLSSTYGLTGVTLKTEDLVDPKALALKEKLIRTTFGLTRVVDTKNADVKNKVCDGLIDQFTSEKATVSKVNPTRKSNSSDREMSRTPRELNSDVEKDKRDSSTESTQSSIEGRRSRSRRDVLSKYAVILTPAQTSPQKADVIEKVGARTSLENASAGEPMIIPLPKLQKRPDIDGKPTADATPSRQTLIQMPKLQKKPDLELPLSPTKEISQKDNDASVIETRPQSNKDPSHYTVMEVNKNNVKSLLCPANPDVRKSPLKSEPRRLQGRPQKTYFAPRLPSGSGASPSGSRPVSTVKIAPARKNYASPQKYNMSTSTRRKPFLEYIAAQSSSEDITTLRVAQTSSRGASAVQCEDTKELELERDEIKNSETDSKLIIPTKGVDVVLLTSIPSLSEKQEQIESLEKKSQIKEHIETQEKLQPVIRHMVNSGESDSENSKASDKFVSKGGKISPHLPVSALSERPKRKRKVPNKNLDAQDMLSKIHNRKPAVPRKKAKLSNVKSRKLTSDKKARRKQPSDDDSSSDGEEEIKDFSAKNTKMARGAKKRASASSNCFDVEDDVEIEDSVKVRGRVVSNRIYVLNESNAKVQKLKCYDQTRVGKYINLENTSCLQCGEMCTSISNLRRHVIRQHLKWSRFKCKLCRFESYDRSECTTHIFRTHKKIAAHNFSSRRSLNALIIDLVKEGLQARSLKKNRTLKGKQKSQNEGNIYTRPNVRKLPRLPERAAAAALLGARNSLSPIPLTDRDAAIPYQSSNSLSPSSNTSISPSDSWYNVSPSGKLRKVTPIRAEARNPVGSPNYDLPKNTTSQGVKKESWFKVLPSGRLKKVLPFNISTRNSPRNFDTSPYKQAFLTKGNGEEIMLHTRKGKYTKANKCPAVRESCKNLANGSTSHFVELDNSPATEDVGSREKLSNSKEGHSKKIEKQTRRGDSHERERGPSLLKPPSHESASETAQPQLKRGRSSSGDSAMAPPQSLKPSVKYIITTTDGLQRYVEKSPKTMTVTNNPSNKIREITTENSPALSDQLAKSLMKLKKLGDSMSTSTKTTPTTSAATSGGGSNALVLSSSVSASTTSTPVTVVGKMDTLPGKSQGSGVSVSIPLSLPSGSTPSSFVLTRGASGKIIVYTHSAEDKQGTPTSVNHPLKTLLPSPLTTSKITVKSKELGNKPGAGANANSEEASLPSGTFVIQQHFL